MSRIDEIIASARGQGVRPWIAAKELCSRAVIETLASDERAVLQGGAALHFAYGSSRLSADVDFVGPAVASALSEMGPGLAAAASAVLDAPAHWSLGRSGRLLRGKILMELDEARRLVLPVEAYEVPAHHSHTVSGLGRVEDPMEIAADKIVASASRLHSRGALKTRDVYDLWFLQKRLGAGDPDLALVATKAADYGEEPRHQDLRAAVLAISEDELRQALEGVLPAVELADLEPQVILSCAAEVLQKYRHVL